MDDIKYYYKVYGLNIESDILIPEFEELKIEDRHLINVNLSYGKIPEHIKKAISNGRVANYNKQDMWFHIKDVATYHIYNGDTVVIEPEANSDFQILKVYIMGSVLGMVLLQKNIVAIHGGGIVIDGKGCVFTGDKGAGKSTLTTALRQRGYKFIADDVCSINSYENTIYTGFGYQKLCEDTMIKLGYDVSYFEPFRSDFNIKYIVPALDSFINEEVSFDALFELRVGDVDKVEIKEIVGREKIDNLMKNIFRIEIINYSHGMNPIYFKKCLDIAKNIKMYSIVRPEGIFSVDNQIEMIENIVKEHKEEDAC